MSNKKFLIAVAAVLAAGIISTAALAAYTVYRHYDWYIRTYMGRER